MGWCLWGWWCGFCMVLVWLPGAGMGGGLMGRGTRGGGEEGEVVVVGGVGGRAGVLGEGEVGEEDGMTRRRRTLVRDRGRSRRRRRRRSRGGGRGSGLGWPEVRQRGIWRVTGGSATTSGTMGWAEGDGETTTADGGTAAALGLAPASAGAVAGHRAQPAGGQAHDKRALGTDRPVAAEGKERGSELDINGPPLYSIPYPPSAS